MKRMKKLPAHVDSASSRGGLGGKVAHYRDKEKIYSKGAPAYTPLLHSRRRIPAHYPIETSAVRRYRDPGSR
jgi:hypothetical protein